MEREYRQLRYTVEHKRAREASHSFEVILARHALALHDGGGDGALIPVARDFAMHVDFITATIGGDAFRRTVCDIVVGYFTKKAGAAAKMDRLLSALYLPHARSQVGEMRGLVVQYFGYAAQVKRGTDDGYFSAWNALVCAMELGQWLDKTM